MNGSQLMTDDGLTVSEVEQKEGSTSGTEPTEEGAEYFDALANITITGEDGAAVLGTTQTQLGRGYISRELLREEVKQGNLDADGGWDPFDGRSRTKEERAGGKAKAWDSIVFDLTQYAADDQPRARRAIIEALKSPDYTVQTNTGATRTVKGERSYTAWGIHRQQGVGSHFQMKVFNHVLDGRKIRGSSALGLDFIRDMENRAIDAALEAEGLAPLVGGGIQRAAVSGKAEQAAKVQSQIAAKRGGATPEPETLAPYMPSDPHTERERFRGHQREELRRAAEIQAELEAITMRAAILADAAAALDTLEALKKENEAEKAARAQADATAKTEAEERQKAEEREALANANAQRLAAEREELSEKLAEETTERQAVEAELDGDRAALVAALGAEAEGEQPEAVAGLIAVALATAQADAADSKTKAAQLEENLGALVAKLTAASERADKAEAKATAEESRANKAEGRADAAESRADKSETVANDLRTKLSESERMRSVEQEQYLRQLNEEREDFKKRLNEEREDFKKRLAEERDEARKAEAGNWEKLVESLKEEVAQWKQNAGMAAERLDSFIKKVLAKEGAAKTTAPKTAKTEPPKASTKTEPPKGGGLK